MLWKSHAVRGYGLELKQGERAISIYVLGAANNYIITSSDKMGDAYFDVGCSKQAERRSWQDNACEKRISTT